MKTFEIITLLIFVIVILSLIDRWYFRKIEIISREKIDGERFKINAKCYLFFNFFKVKMRYIEYNGDFYPITRKSPLEIVDTHEVEPRMVKKALLKYNLENGFK